MKKLTFSYDDDNYEQDEIILAELEDYGLLEGCEEGEYIGALIHICRCGWGDMMSSKFKEALKNELNDKYVYYTTHTKIVEETVIEPHHYKTLEWIN